MRVNSIYTYISKLKLSKLKKRKLIFKTWEVQVYATVAYISGI